MPSTAKHRHHVLCGFPTVGHGFPTSAMAFGGKKGRSYVLHCIRKLWVYTSVHDTKLHTSVAPVRKSPGHLNPSFVLEEEQKHHARSSPSTVPLPPRSPLPTFRQEHSALLVLLWSHLCVKARKHLSSSFRTLPPSTQWPSLMKLWLLLYFHFALLHAHGRGQSLPRMADQLNRKERG